MKRFGHKPFQGPTEAKNQVLPRQQTDLWRVGFAEPSLAGRSGRFAELDDGQMPLLLDEGNEEFEQHAIIASGLDGRCSRFDAAAGVHGHASGKALMGTELVVPHGIQIEFAAHGVQPRAARNSRMAIRSVGEYRGLFLGSILAIRASLMRSSSLSRAFSLLAVSSSPESLTLVSRESAAHPWE